MEAYLGVPLRVGNKVYGTLNFSRPEPRAPYSDFEWELLKLMGQWISYELTREANQRALERERSLFIGGPTVVFVWGAEAHRPVTYVSPNIEADFGYAPDDLLGQAFTDLIHPDDRQRVMAAIGAHPDPGATSHEQEYRLRAGDGGYRWVYDFTVPTRDDSGRVESLQGYLLDITARRELEAEQRLLATAFHTSQALLITDAWGRIERVNPAFTAITGYPAEEVIGRNPRLLASGCHDAAFYQALWGELAEHGHWEGEIWNRRKNGEIFPEWESISAVRNEAGEIEHYVAVFHDISEQKRLEAELERLATHDRLTGIYNRGKLYEALGQAQAEFERYATPFAVIMFDIDHFKAINDRFGHGVGDAVLRELTQRVAALMRDTDHFGRWGGEEFLVVAGHTDDAGAGRLAERIRRAAADTPFAEAGGITLSLGVAESQPGEAVESLEERADNALYAAKAGGRNRVVSG
jgi:diguanylate cyclase (GGDEF)-like protein/PAS domain S-box-containing protein